MNIQKAIRLHDPRIIDVVLSLALTHEEPLEEARQYSSAKYKHDYKSPSKHTYGGKGIMPTDDLQVHRAVVALS